MLDSHGFEDISSTDLVKQLDKHPQLKARIKAMLDVVENSDGDVVKADEAEQRFIEELRLMGLTAMHAWDQRKQAKVEALSDSRSDLTCLTFDCTHSGLKLTRKVAAGSDSR